MLSRLLVVLCFGASFVVAQFYLFNSLSLFNTTKSINARLTRMCNCEDFAHGQCDNNGQCICNPGWTNAANGTLCAQCEQGFFLDSSGNCQVCGIGCSRCADGTGTCLHCEPGFTQDLNPNFTSMCITLNTCPTLTYSTINGTCESCSPACHSCTGGTSNDCITCSTGTYMFNGTCVLASAKGVCEGTNGMIADNNKNECDACRGNCTTCEIPGFDSASPPDVQKCTGCDSGMFLNASSSCYPCHSTCDTCSGPSDSECMTCPPQAYFYNGSCLSNCFSGTYADNTSTCQPCDPSCTACMGPGNGNCSQCTSGYFINNSTCQRCDPSCATCGGPGFENCSECAQGYFMHDGECIVYRMPVTLPTFRRYTSDHPPLTRKILLLALGYTLLIGGCMNIQWTLLF